MFAGFNHKKRSSIGGDFDGDGVKNRKDCSPLNHKKQDNCADCGEATSKYDMTKDKDGQLICMKCSKENVMKRVSHVRRW